MSEIQEPSHDLRADASAQRIARVYAEALLDEAQRCNVAAEVQQEMDSLLQDVTGSNPLLGSFFLGGVVGRGTRKEALEAAFTGRVSDLFRNFIVVLNDHDRLELLRPIATAYKELLEERSGQVVVEVASAVPLADDYREKLKRQLRDMTGKEPVLQATVDPALLGGLVVRIGDYLYDASVRTRLATIRNNLFESSSHEIQVGRDRFSTS